MTTLIENLLERYNKLVMEDKYADPRSKDIWLVSSPLTVFTITACYLYFCTKVGPRFMQDRKPYELKKIMFVYNLAQIGVSLYIAVYGLILWCLNYNWICQPQDFADTPLNREVISISNIYFKVKLIDFLDTVFFVLRKKDRQISFLHLFHHTLMFVSSWIGLRYFNTGHGVMFGIVNSFVHAIMYTYYFISGLGPEYQKYIWWKKHVTLIQLVQFVLVFLHNLIAFASSCTYPKYLNFLEMLFASVFIYMFGKFYIQNYGKEVKGNAKRD